MPKKVKELQPATRDYTIHLGKSLNRVTYKNKAPRAIREIRKFVSKAMGTKDVRITTELNKAVWKDGIHGTPTRVRVRLSRRRNEDEEAKESFYTLVSYINVGKNVKGLITEKVEEEAQ